MLPLESARPRSKLGGILLDVLPVGLDNGWLEANDNGLRFFNTLIGESGAFPSLIGVSGAMEGRKRPRLFRFCRSVMSDNGISGLGVGDEGYG